MHVSLDGFAAGPKGEMNWIHVDEEIFDYAGERTNSADTALYGRVTFEMMQAYWPTAGNKPNASKHDIEHSTWYNKVVKIVLSKTMKEEDLTNTTVISDNVEDKINKLKQQPGNDILMFGSPSAAHTLMQADLIDDFWLFINPVLIGKGIPVFKNVNRTPLKLIASTAFSSGVVCLHYQK